MGFAERLHRLGLDLETEVSQAIEVASRSSRSEAQLLQEEVEWLQSQLHAERAQSDARLKACSEVKEQLQDAEDRARRHREAAEYWQAEFNIKEEQFCLLEAKLAAIALSEAEAESSAATGTAGTGANATQATRSACDPQESKELEAEHWKLLDVSPAEMCGSTDVVPEALRPSLSDETAVQRCLDVYQNGLGLELDMDAEGFHSLLLAAIRRPEGSCDLLNRILRSWACCLLNRHEGLAIKTAVTMGNLEALEALVSLGGPSAVATATALPTADNGQDASAPEAVVPERTEGLLCSCAAKGDSASLALLLEHLHDRRTLEIIRKARAVASQHGHRDVSQLLATHLVVELSYVGNSKYRAGEYDSAIRCYQEAIDICEEHGGPGACASPASTSVASCHRDNLVGLRYNLARAFHRSDRWMQAREQATLVLQLDSQYLNAYALRAQAAMSALDWSAAKEDWERLLERGGPHSSEVLRAWRRRQDECCRQLAQDHYEILGLPPLAEPEEVRRAYRDLARRWHPDKHQSRSLDLRDRAAQRFTRIRHAYEVLSDEGLKQSYDVQLRHEARPMTSRGGLGSHSKEPESDIERHWADHEQTL